MKSYMILLLVLMTLVSAHAREYQLEYNDSATPQLSNDDPRFAIQTLKYDPYPANPGEWFDLWVVAENIGEQDAHDVSFAIVDGYPFTSEGKEYRYASISGSRSAYKERFPDENVSESNQVLLKYRVKAAESAAEGTQALKLVVTFTGERATTEKTYQLPVAIQKTKTDFDITMHEATWRRTVFAIANTGDKTASAITVRIDRSLVEGPNEAIIGSLAPGDFTTVSFHLNATGASDVPLSVSYTDAAGVRTTMERTVPVSLPPEPAAAPVPDTNRILGMNGNWVFAFAGLIIGLVMAILLRRKPTERAEKK